MKDLVIPYWLVQDLLNIGYGEETHFYYNKATTGLWEVDERIWECSDDMLPAILWDQAFMWFNKKHNLYSWIESYYNEEWFPEIEETLHPKN